MKRRVTQETRREILAAAEAHFAAAGFGSASINDIAAATCYSKPVIYYHFGSKAGLFKALLSEAYDQCYDIMRSAAAKSRNLEKQLVEILTALFSFLGARKDLTRLAFAAAFAAPREVPRRVNDESRRMRNFEFFHTLIREGLARGTLDTSFDSRTLAYGIYGALSFYLMANLLLPGTKLSRSTARQVVKLFMNGAMARRKR